MKLFEKNWIESPLKNGAFGFKTTKTHAALFRKNAMEILAIDDDISSTNWDRGMGFSPEDVFSSSTLSFSWVENFQGQS
jgi:hypothetical protein